jgi:hypothetical protein
MAPSVPCDLIWNTRQYLNFQAIRRSGLSSAKITHPLSWLMTFNTNLEASRWFCWVNKLPFIIIIMGHAWNASLIAKIGTQASILLPFPTVRPFQIWNQRDPLFKEYSRRFRGQGWSVYPFMQPSHSIIPYFKIFVHKPVHVVVLYFIYKPRAFCTRAVLSGKLLAS